MVRLVGLALLVSLAACDRAGARHPGCVFQATSRTDGAVQFGWVEHDVAEAWQMPAEVTVSATARREGPHLVVTGVVRNTAAEPREVVYLTGGEPGSTNPFNTTVHAPVRPKPPLPPQPRRENYPEPMRATLTGGAAIVYEHRHCAADYVLGGEVRASWGFEAWRGDRPHGEVAIR